MKKLLAMIVCLSLFSTSIFASVDAEKVALLNTTIKEMKGRMALEGLTPAELVPAAISKLIKAGVTADHVETYLQTTEGGDKIFSAVQLESTLMKEAVMGMENVQNSALQQEMFQELFSSSLNSLTTGANYRGCVASTTVGGLFLGGSIAMAFLSLYYAGYLPYNGSCDFFGCWHYSRDSYKAEALGIASGVTLAASIGVFLIPCGY